MSEVNAVNMAKWIVALRSGKYTQGRGGLRTFRGEYCCLGVACEISRIGAWKGDAYSTDSSASDILLPIPVSDWLGLHSSNPDLTPGIGCSGANDYHRWSFTQIADALESRYLPNTTAEKDSRGASMSYVKRALESTDPSFLPDTKSILSVSDTSMNAEWDKIYETLTDEDKAVLLGVNQEVVSLRSTNQQQEPKPARLEAYRDV